MAENEGMEGKDLATEEKKEFNEQVLEEVQKLKNGESKMIIGELEATKVQDQVILNVRGKSIAIVRGNEIEYNLANFEELKKSLEEEGQTLEDLGLPDLQAEIDKIQKQNSEKQEAKETEQDEQNKDGEENSGEEQEEEKDDEKPDLEEDKDPKKEEIAKKYNVNKAQVIHIAKDEKITEHERFQGLVKWAEDRDDVYIIPGEDPYTYKFIGEKDGELEEIEAGNNKVIGGKNPDVTIKRIDGEAITEIKPLAMYEVDNQSAIAIVENEHGDPEALYCRQQGGNEKEYWGSIIPEASGKNVYQQEPEVRNVMDYKNNSDLDVENIANQISEQVDLENRGWPSDEKGAQIKETTDKDKQNVININNAVQDLDKRYPNEMPGKHKVMAKKMLMAMTENKSLTYEDALRQVEQEGQREPGGRTQGEPRDRRGE